MRNVSVYVESGVSMVYDVGSAAWVYDLDLWGVCGQGTDEGAALRDLGQRLGRRVDLVVTERLQGRERTFTPDHRPCAPRERWATLDILDRTRQETLLLLGSCTEAELDSLDHNRFLPAFARWPTLRQRGWQVADHACRHYLPRAGLPAKPPAGNLFDELSEADEYVRSHVRDMPADVLIERDGQVWTTIKLLRRLAWHGRAQLALMRTTLTRLRGER